MAEVKKSKQIIYGEEVRRKIRQGVTTVAEAVGTTLGSRGGNVAYELSWGTPNVLHDGVSVAKQIVLEDPFENEAAQLVIQAAQNTNNQAGDGTTTATILTAALVTEAIAIMSGGNVNPQVIRRGIDEAVRVVIDQLNEIKTPVMDKERMQQIATISAADATMGKQIAEAVEKVGRGGVVTVQEGGAAGLTVEYKRGMEFERGILSQYMVTNFERQEAVSEKTKDHDDAPYVIAVNEKLTNDVMVRLLEMVLSVNPLAKFLLIADDYDIAAAQTIIKTIGTGKRQIVAVNSPEYGKLREQVLTDIGILTGGKVLGGQSGVNLIDAKLEDIGRCDQVVASLNQTIVIDGHGDSQLRAEHIKGLQKQRDAAKDIFEKDKFETRLAKLSGGVAVISVGAASETEAREMKERVYDAVNATQAAVSDGIVPGGGVALLRARKALKKLKLGRSQVGVDIVYHALELPMRKLVDNAGLDDPGYVIGKVEELTNPNMGYNVETETVEDMLQAGIVDPVKVTKSALINAASVSNMLITTRCMIAFNRKELYEYERMQDLEGVGGLTGQ